MEKTLEEHFNNLFDIIKQYPESYFAEGNIVFEGGGNVGLSERFKHKRDNLRNLAKKHDKILEIGFNAGHSSLLMLLSNPNCTIQSFDLGEHPYTRPCFQYLAETFPNRIKIILGDSTKTVPAFIAENPDAKYTMLHVDGGHDDYVFMQDVYNCRSLAEPNNVVIVDDDNMPAIHTWNRRWMESGFFKPYDFPEVSTQANGNMEHYIASYNLTTKHEKQIVISRYNKDIAWVPPNNYGVIIYNKSQSLPKSIHPSFIVKNVPNIGLDQATFLQYIVDSYDNLPSIVLFAQDDLDAHVYETLNFYNTNTPKGNPAYYINLMFEEASMHGFSQNAFPYTGFGDFAPSYNFKLPAMYNEHKVPETFGVWFEKNIKSPYPKDNFLWFKNSIFAVKKEYILSRPKHVYKAILDQLQHERSELLHFMERSWYYLLNLD